MVEAVVIGRLMEIEELAERVYINTVPQEEGNPYAVVYVVSTSPTSVKDTVSPIDRIRVQVSVFARTYLDALSIADSVREYLDGYVSSLETESCRFTFEDRRGDFDEGADMQLITTDFFCDHKRDISINLNN